MVGLCKIRGRGVRRVGGGHGWAAVTPNILNKDSKLFTTVRGEGAARPV